MDMLQVDGEVQNHDGQRHAGPYRHAERMEQAPPSRLGDQCQPGRRRRKHEADQNRVKNDDADVARPAGAAPQLLLAAWRENLPGGHRREDGGEDEEPHERLVAEQHVRHGAIPPAGIGCPS
jgi:hypothetical protein